MCIRDRRVVSLDSVAKDNSDDEEAIEGEEITIEGEETPPMVEGDAGPEMEGDE